MTRVILQVKHLGINVEHIYETMKYDEINEDCNFDLINNNLFKDT